MLDLLWALLQFGWAVTKLVVILVLIYGAITGRLAWLTDAEMDRRTRHG